LVPLYAILGDDIVEPLEASFNFLPDEAALSGLLKWTADEAMDRLVEA
jgi:hypothetical protein